MPPDATSIVVHQFGFSVIVVYLIQALKDSPRFKWLQTDTDKLNRLASLLLAFLTSLGIQFVVTGNAMQGGSILIKIPSIMTLLNALVYGAGQFGMQQALYQKVIKRAS